MREAGARRILTVFGAEGHSPQEQRPLLGEILHYKARAAPRLMCHPCRAHTARAAFGGLARPQLQPQSQHTAWATALDPAGPPPAGRDSLHVACTQSDFVFVTNNNPRFESPTELAEDLCAGAHAPFPSAQRLRLPQIDVPLTSFTFAHLPLSRPA